VKALLIDVIAVCHREERFPRAPGQFFDMME